MAGLQLMTHLDLDEDPYFMSLCARLGVPVSDPHRYFMRVCMFMYTYYDIIYIYICMHARIYTVILFTAQLQVLDKDQHGKRARMHIHTYTHKHIHTYTCMHTYIKGTATSSRQGSA